MPARFARAPWPCEGPKVSLTRGVLPAGQEAPLRRPIAFEPRQPDAAKDRQRPALSKRCTFAHRTTSKSAASKTCGISDRNFVAGGEQNRPYAAYELAHLRETFADLLPKYQNLSIPDLITSTVKEPLAAHSGQGRQPVRCGLWATDSIVQPATRVTIAQRSWSGFSSRVRSERVRRIGQIDSSQHLVSSEVEFKSLPRKAFIFDFRSTEETIGRDLAAV